MAEQSGQIERRENGDDVLRTVGVYLYTGDDGKEYRVDYVADENGFIAKVYTLRVDGFFLDIFE